MALGRWQATIVDSAGNVLPSAQVTVRREIAGAPLAVLYSDRNGTTPVNNPLTADGNGFVFFHATGGAFRIDAVSGSSTITWRYVPVGLSGEGDAPVVDVSYVFSSTTADADPGNGTFRFNNATLSSVTTIYIDLLDDLGSDMTTWLDRLDDAGATTDRGQLTIRAIDGSAEYVAKITGSITTATGYRKITVSYLTSSGAFVDAGRCTVTFAPRGQNGTGDVVGPGSSATNNLAVFADTTGKLLKDGGKSFGKHSIWVPASAIYKRTADAGPSTGQLAVSAFVGAYLAYDSASLEDGFFTVAMPKSWNVGQISAQVYWSHPATTTNFAVLWGIFATAYSNADLIDGASYGGGGSSLIDTGGTTNDLYISPEGTAFTVGNSPSDGDLIHFIIRRTGSDGTDTLAVDAFLHGVMIFYTTDATTDD